MKSLMTKNVYIDGCGYGVWFSKVEQALSIFEVIDLETGQRLPDTVHEQVLKELELAMEYSF
ncbi:MAG: hypothetical protein GOV02_03010 [Candidatus Aenigmarchaeota archaeon]|nr:hypothetical protein [Candidatus Aenigmarchaeota archaeon]